MKWKYLGKTLQAWHANKESIDYVEIYTNGSECQNLHQIEKKRQIETNIKDTRFKTIFEWEEEIKRKRLKRSDHFPVKTFSGTHQAVAEVLQFHASSSSSIERKSSFFSY